MTYENEFQLLYCNKSNIKYDELKGNAVFLKHNLM